MSERKRAPHVPGTGWREWVWFALATLYALIMFGILIAMVFSGMPGTFWMVGIVAHLVLTAIMRRF